MTKTAIQIAASTNVGLVRTNNEDNFVVCPDLTTSDWRIPQVSKYEDLGEYGALLVVADGMGGANAGEVASAIAIETIREAFSGGQLKEIVKNEKAVQEFMKEVVKAADFRIFKKSKQDSSTQGMGTTVVMAWILNKSVYVCWCGDSRCYMLNKHKGLVRLSKDHSYVQELIDRGELDPDLAMNHPYSNVITRCLGDMENRAVPDTRVFQIHNGDTILLCSDGLSGLCTDLQILDLLIKYRDNIEKCKEELITAALNEGGHDNVTIALCNIEIPDEKDEEDNALPKGTLPPVPEKGEISETLKSEKSQKSQQKPSKKRRFWKGMLLFFVMVAIAFFSVKWLRTHVDVLGNKTVTKETTNSSTGESSIEEKQEVNIKEESIEIPNIDKNEQGENRPKQNPEKKQEAEETTEPSGEKEDTVETQSKQTSEQKPEAEETISPESVSTETNQSAAKQTEQKDTTTQETKVNN